MVSFRAIIIRYETNGFRWLNSIKVLFIHCRTLAIVLWIILGPSVPLKRLSCATLLAHLLPRNRPVRVLHGWAVEIGYCG